MEHDFAVGDRVFILWDVHGGQTGQRRGEVTRRYGSAGYRTLYTVRWDDGSELDGYLPHRLYADDVKD